MKDSDVKKFAQNKIKELRQEIAKWEKVLSAFGDNFNKQNGETITPINKQADLIKVKSKYQPSDKVTIREKATAVLISFDCPIVSSELMERMNELYPERIYNMNSFSGAFSAMYQKPNSGIKQYIMKNATLKVKALYGLNEWFDETGELKHIYQEKVKEKYGTL
jgi:hypothetical protein